MRHPERGWEFGCAHILETSDWGGAIRKGYKKKYALDIKVGENPVPIATYTYRKSENGKDKTALGLIVLAEVEKVERENFRFITENEIDSLEGKMVDSFQENAHRAFELNRK